MAQSGIHSRLLVAIAALGLEGPLVDTGTVAT
jgi:hypothetical protein